MCTQHISSPDICSERWSLRIHFRPDHKDVRACV
uniref:Uncharacterized protein n=1 Tax=Anguilla anguilla TaxID=7936 RepID=A0A0E9WG32_ANGAN